MRFYFALIVVFSAITGFSQDTDVSKYFTPKKVSDPNNVFKVDLLSAFGGDVVFLYERFLSDAISAEIGGGFLLENGVRPFYEIAESGEFRYSREGGTKFVFTVMYHPDEERREGFNYGLMMFQRNINARFEGDRFSWKEFHLGYYQGYRLELSDWISTEIGMSVGYLFVNIPANEVFPSAVVPDSNYNFLFTLKFGIHK